ncbi:pregnancy-specific glycoprotein 22-like [Discoglossus pictus]
MGYLHYLSLIFYFLQTGAVKYLPCGDPTIVSGIEGGDVILKVDKTNIKDISWIRGDEHFASTKPGGLIETRDDGFAGKVYGMSDASLIITNLTREDQGIYTANVYCNKERRQYLQYYDLRVQAFLCDTPCGDTSNITGVEGGNVILQVYKNNIMDISWIRKSHHFGSTKPGGIIQLRENRFAGKVNGTSDASLIIKNLKKEDQGIYTANILSNKDGQHCKQHYDLRVNSVVSDKPCDDTTIVTGIYGGDTILQVDENDIKGISWLIGGNHFASTKPGGIIESRENQFARKVDGTYDASLKITNLTEEDQAIYTANILRNKEGRQCKRYYDLRVHNVLCDPLCGGTRNVVATEGGDTILRINRSNIKYISWIIGRHHFASTKPGGIIEPQDDHFQGKLNGSHDASLIIKHLTMEDQGIYTSNILSNKGEWQCNQHYNLRIYKNISKEDIKIHHNITINETCYFTCSVNAPEVKITWKKIRTDDILMKNHILYVHYENTDFSYICTAENIVSHNSRSIIPSTICKKDHISDGTRCLSIVNDIILPIVVVIVALVAIALLIYVIKKRKQGPNTGQQRSMHDHTRQSDITENIITQPTPTIKGSAVLFAFAMVESDPKLLSNPSRPSEDFDVI